MKSSVAIIGAGFTGLAAAFELSRAGFAVIIYELEKEPGGLAIGFRKPGWEWSLERHYHHWFTNDEAVLALAKRIKYPLIITRPKTSVLTEDQVFPLDSPGDVLAFPKLSPLQRVRMGLGLTALRLDPFWQPLEGFKAAKVLPVLVGEQAYRMLWKPLLEGKFAKFSDEISLAWFWARIVKRTSRLAYPSGGFLDFARAIEKEIRGCGGTFFYGSRVTNVEQLTKTFDNVIVTLPMNSFFAIAPQLPGSYKLKFGNLQGLGVLNLLLRLKRRFLTDGTYWLNICDNKIPILAIVEHTNFMDSSHYGGEHLVYCSNYLQMDHNFFKKNAQELLKIFHPTLEKLHPGFTKELIGLEVFSAPFAQPIISTNFSQKIPSIKTPLPHVYLANIQQVYPWDRGTNYAVELGQKAARCIMERV